MLLEVTVGISDKLMRRKAKGDWVRKAQCARFQVNSNARMDEAECGFTIGVRDTPIWGS